MAGSPTNSQSITLTAAGYAGPPAAEPALRSALPDVTVRTEVSYNDIRCHIPTPPCRGRHVSGARSGRLMAVVGDVLGWERSVAGDEVRRLLGQHHDGR